MPHRRVNGRRLVGHSAVLKSSGRLSRQQIGLLPATYPKAIIDLIQFIYCYIGIENTPTKKMTPMNLIYSSGIFFSFSYELFFLPNKTCARNELLDCLDHQATTHSTLLVIPQKPLRTSIRREVLIFNMVHAYPSTNVVSWLSPNFFHLHASYGITLVPRL